MKVRMRANSLDKILIFELLNLTVSFCYGSMIPGLACEKASHSEVVELILLSISRQ